MPLIKKMLIGTLLLGILLFGGGFFAVRYFFNGIEMISSCGESIEHEVLSPDNKYMATVYLRNCGATTDYVTHINIRNTNAVDKPDNQGVITAGEVFTIPGKQNIMATWKDSANLEIHIPESHSTFLMRSDKIWNLVHIQIKNQ